MKLRIAIIVVFGSLLLSQESIARVVDGEVIINFLPNKVAKAKEVNQNFIELQAAIDDNYTLINSHKNNATIHNGGGNGLGVGGSGAAGVLTIAGEDWINNLNLPSSFNFTKCEIGASGPVTVTIPSGTTLRCQNGFTLFANSTIIIGHGFGAGVDRYVPKYFTSLSNFTISAQPTAGIGLPMAVAMSSLGSLPIGGAGHNSGGYIKILSGGAIKIAGTIKANAVVPTGRNYGSAGGGAGGIVILGSEISIDVIGSIQASGGNGIYDISSNASGGGGGGIVALVAPIITNSDSIVVLPGDPSTSGSSTRLNEGAGGRGCGGNGGTGAAGSFSPTAGTAGYVIKLIDYPNTLGN
jgi:hypothetical protein